MVKLDFSQLTKAAMPTPQLKSVLCIFQFAFIQLSFLFPLLTTVQQVIKQQKPFYVHHANHLINQRRINSMIQKKHFYWYKVSGEYQHERARTSGCWVFQPANGCFACRSLVEIIFFSILSSFSVFYHLFPSTKKEVKHKNIHLKGV